MKNIKKYYTCSLSLFMLTVLWHGAPWHFAEAYSSNAAWTRNQVQIRDLSQIRTQSMTIEQRHEMIRLLTQLQALLRQLIRLQGQSYVSSEVQIATRPASEIEANEAVLNGRVADFNRSDYADVWFEYDTDRNSFDHTTSIERVMSDDDQDFEEKVTGLEEDTTYYFRAVGEDDEEDQDYGMVLSFHTDDEQQGAPDVTTRSATAIADDSAVLRGSVDMNDFGNGKVFFVYGEDQDLIDEVENDFDTYEDVDENGDDLQKILVDHDLDGAGSYEEEVTSLSGDTDLYFNLCVAYEDDDNDEVIMCGVTHSFTTDS